MQEDMADNALVYASVQVMKVGERQGQWHTDGGTSLLHAGLTIFGSRVLDVDQRDLGRISRVQKPGSFYVGNLCSMKHNVRHERTSEGCLGPGKEPAQTAVMLRSDVFRYARARALNTTPGPAELFRIVNTEVAKHLAEEPFPLPGMGDVLAEADTSAD